MGLLAAVAPAVGQRDAGGVAADSIGDELAGWLAANAPVGGRIVMRVLALRTGMAPSLTLGGTLSVVAAGAAAGALGALFHALPLRAPELGAEPHPELPGVQLEDLYVTGPSTGGVRDLLGCMEQ